MRQVYSPDWLEGASGRTEIPAKKSAREQT